MRGWARLWVLLTIIWVVFVGAVTFTVTDWSNEPPWYRIYNNLSTHAQKYYEESSLPKHEPVYKVELKYTDGTETFIRFPIFDEISSNDIVDKLHDDIEEKLIKLAKENKKKVASTEVARFIKLVAIENELAKRALREYQTVSNEQVKRHKQDIREGIIISALAMVIPPVLLLMIGYGIAWVRRGFKKQ